HGKINAGGARGVYGGLQRGIGRREYFHPIHRPIGDKEAFATRVINDMAVMWLARGAIKQKHGIIADIIAARKVLRRARLDGKRKIRGMRKGSAGALRGHGELPRGGV